MTEFLWMAFIQLLTVVLLMAGVVWVVERAHARHESHMREVLDRFLSRTFSEYQTTQALMQQSADREVLQQEFDEDDPEFIGRLLKEAEEALVKE